MNSQQMLQEYQQLVQEQMETSETAAVISLIIAVIWTVVGLLVALSLVAALWNLSGFLKVKTEEAQFNMSAAEMKQADQMKAERRTVGPVKLR